MNFNFHFTKQLFSLVSLIALTACGGDDTPLVCEPPSCTLPSQALLDGVVYSDGFTETNGSAANPTTGDLDSFTPGRGSRQFYSFDLSSVPATATVTSAVLRLFQAFVSGQPYTVLGIVIVDHVNYGLSLDSGDYNGGAIANNIGTLSTSGALVYWQLDVTSSVLDDITNGRTNSQYRIRFSSVDSNSDGFNDFAAFTDGEQSCCSLYQPPQLVLTLN